MYSTSSSKDYDEMFTFTSCVRVYKKEKPQVTGHSVFVFFEMELSSPKIPCTFPGMIDWDSLSNFF